MEWVLGPLMAIVGIALGVWCVVRLRAFGHAVHLERARESFKLQRERLEAQFLQKANTTGKPRGLIWKDCQWDDPVTFARDRESRTVLALIGITIQFEAVAGSDMEGHSEVDKLRGASAVFVFEKGHWLTVGKAVFNMNPDEAIQHFHLQYERIT